MYLVGKHKMDENIDNNVSVLAMLDNQSYKPSLNMVNYQTTNHVTHDHNINHGHQNQILNQDAADVSENSKQGIVWTKHSTLTLLRLYETKMNILDNPKKKSKMWLSIAEELKGMGIEVTADQVRWKINALTKKYKDCIDIGQGAIEFKYFNEMHQILGHCDKNTHRQASGITPMEKEGNKRLLLLKKTVPYRRLRAERRAKADLDKQWIEYIQKQDEQREIRDERLERSLRLREEELQLKKKELEIKQSIALKKLQLKERKQEEILKIEREKCALLRKLLDGDTINSTNCHDDLQNSTHCIGVKHNLTQRNNITEKQSAVWTPDSTTVLLNLYDQNLEMLETPKKKKRIWISISHNLKNYAIIMTPNQVRWKINALTKRYKQCFEKGTHHQFKYFNAMENIYSKYNVDCDSYLFADAVLDRKINTPNNIENLKLRCKENNAIIKLRKLRLQNRIESDRSQSRIYLERQWLEYLQRLQCQNSRSNVIKERKIKLLEQRVQLQKRKLEMTNSLELKNMIEMEKDLDVTLKAESEKCDLLRELFYNRY